MLALRPAPLAQLRAAPRPQRVRGGRVPSSVVSAAVVAGRVPRRATALRAVRADGPSAEVVRARLRRAGALHNAAATPIRRPTTCYPTPHFFSHARLPARFVPARFAAQDLNMLAQLKQNGEDRFTALCMEGNAGAAGAEPDANSGLRRQVRAALELLETGLLERETEVRLLLLAALAGEHLLLLGAQPLASRRDPAALRSRRAPQARPAPPSRSWAAE